MAETYKTGIDKLPTVYRSESPEIGAAECQAHVEGILIDADLRFAVGSGKQRICEIGELKFEHLVEIRKTVLHQQSCSA